LTTTEYYLNKGHLLQCIFIGDHSVPLLHHEDMMLYSSLSGMTSVVKSYQVVW